MLRKGCSEGVGTHVSDLFEHVLVIYFRLVKSIIVIDFTNQCAPPPMKTPIRWPLP